MVWPYFLAEAQTGPAARGCGSEKYLLWKKSATLTNAIITGTSTSGPMTAAKAAPEWA
jgi:hypothetical protein